MVFQDGKIYKITSVADGSVLDLPGARTDNETRILTYFEYHGGNHQKWLALKSGSGFELTSLIQANTTKCMDQSVGGGFLSHYQRHRGPNQQWTAREISPGANVYAIVSVVNGKCLQNQGSGKDLAVASPVRSNSWQYFTIQQV